MEIRTELLKELEEARKFSYIPPQVIGQFEEFIDSPHGNLLRTNNIPHHVCTFFLPIHRASRSIYLVHHIKANDWIPPGGHIDPDETPIETVRREYAEELSYKIDTEPIKLVNLTIKHIRNSRHPCLTHYDFWYSVEMKDRVDFTYDKNEFYDASWFSLTEGLKKMALPMYRNAISECIFRV